MRRVRCGLRIFDAGFCCCCSGGCSCCCHFYGSCCRGLFWGCCIFCLLLYQQLLLLLLLLQLALLVLLQKQVQGSHPFRSCSLPFSKHERIHRSLNIFEASPNEAHGLTGGGAHSSCQRGVMLMLLLLRLLLLQRLLRLSLLSLRTVGATAASSSSGSCCCFLVNFPKVWKQQGSSPFGRSFDCLQGHALRPRSCGGICCRCCCWWCCCYCCSGRLEANRGALGAPECPNEGQGEGVSQLRSMMCKGTEVTETVWKD